MKFTQRLTMHLNGGKKFSERRYDLFADGKSTNLKRVTRTIGSPRHLVSVDVILDVRNPDNPVEFDLLETNVGLQAWLEANVVITEVEGASPAVEPTS